MDHTAYTKALSRWFGCVPLAGVLIGLGGPFWFNAFSSLSAVIQLARGRADEQAAGGACGADQSPPPAFKPA